MTRRFSLALHLLALAVLCAVLYLPYLGKIPFFDKGEPREALAVQDIVQRGEWLFPLKRATAIPSKPPLFHWSAALTARVTGTLDEATIRFPSAFYATVGVWFVYLLGRKVYGGEVGLLAGAILATTLIYQNQALSARVDMTLSFFVTLSLFLFYSLYRGFLIHPLWNFALYTVLGIGALAKGPLGILLPGLVIAAFLALKKQWRLIGKFAFHPGVIITLVLAVGWYGLAIIRGGEGFVNRQLLDENLERFFGGSGHDGPVYYYISYLFALGLPWSLFLPFVLWDSFKSGTFADDNELFLWVWLGGMFIFFSASAGKRAVYLLPVYPAISLLIAAWLYRAKAAIGTRLWLFRAVAIFAATTGVVLLLIVSGDLWGAEPGRFFSAVESLLKPKDRANFEVIENQLAGFSWRFHLAALLAALLWFFVAYSLWKNRLILSARQLVLIAIVTAFIGRGLVMPGIAEGKSYRDFMQQVGERLQPGDKLYLHGKFNSDAVIFYHGGVIAALDQAVQIVPGRTGKDNGYIIMDERTWNRLRQVNFNLPAPLLKSHGSGPEGDTPLVLVAAKVS